MESIYNKLHTTKIQKADFKDMLAIHGALFEKFENVVKLGNINAVMDAVFKFAEVLDRNIILIFIPHSFMVLFFYVASLYKYR